MALVEATVSLVHETQLPGFSSGRHFRRETNLKGQISACARRSRGPRLYSNAKPAAAICFTAAIRLDRRGRPEALVALDATAAPAHDDWLHHRNLLGGRLTIGVPRATLAEAVQLFTTDRTASKALCRPVPTLHGLLPSHNSLAQPRATSFPTGIGLFR